MRHPFELECQVDKSDHVQHILLCGLNQRQKAEKAAPGICTMYGNEFITDRKNKTANDFFIQGEDVRSQILRVL